MNDFERLAQQLYHQLPPKFDANALAAVLAGGLLAKDALVDGAIYWGWCRNSSRARWKAARSRFVYRRTKFGLSLIHI